MQFTQMSATIAGVANAQCRVMVIKVCIKKFVLSGIQGAVELTVVIIYLMTSKCQRIVWVADSQRVIRIDIGCLVPPLVDCGIVGSVFIDSL